jgi:HK97 gp10 family phage protein
MADFNDAVVRVEGLADLEAALKDCKEEIAKKIMRNATAAGGRIFRDLMRQKAPRDKGDLAEDIVVTSRADLANGRFICKVYPRRKPRKGMEKEIAAIYKALWLEFGVKPHAEIRKNGKAIAFDPTKGGLKSSANVIVFSVQHPGISPHPFMRPAADEGWPKALETFKQAIITGLDKIGRTRRSRSRS